MKQGVILEAARRDSRDKVKGALVVVAICAAVLALNWKYVYNFVAGPFRFDASLSAAPGPREFVRVEGTLVPTGVVQETTFRLLRGLAESKSITASYMGMLVDRRVLIVKVDQNFSGQTVEGTLTPLPETIRASLGPTVPSHPWLVDADVAYRWNPNIFVLITGPLFLITVPLLLYFMMQAGRLERHAAFRDLARFGSPADVAAAIEKEIGAADEKGRVGPFWLTPSWFVTLQPWLQLYPTADLMGVARKTVSTKSANQTSQKHILRFWRRGHLLPDDLPVTEAETRAVLQALTARFPWLVVEDADVFERRWAQNRAACEQDVDGRRS